MNKDQREVIRKGLDQIHSEGLQRLVEHIDAKRPLLLTGAILGSVDSIPCG